MISEEKVLVPLVESAMLVIIDLAKEEKKKIPFKFMSGSSLYLKMFPESGLVLINEYASKMI